MPHHSAVSAPPAIAAAMRVGARGGSGFGRALAAELERPAHRPAAADPASMAMLGLAAKVAATDVTVLINGPTGTGKEVLAQFIHRESGRGAKPLIAVNCAALPETMLEAMLFGHEKGAFTGALAASKGLVRAADGGTLLLDEITEMPVALQAKLLRVLQEREVTPVGATDARPVDLRVVACANRDLRAEVAAGRFRADLYYRLSVFPIATRPLAERPADLVAIVAALLVRHAAGRATFAWPTDAALAKLAAHGWPGNVRELDNVLQRALVLCDGDAIDAADIMLDDGAAPAAPVAATGTLDQIVRVREAEAISAALAACAGRRGDAATRLGISERTLRYKLADMARAPSPAVGAATA